MLDILDIENDSIAEELGLKAGDQLIAINGQPVRDLIDYQLLTAGEDLVLEVERSDGELWEIEFEKDAEEPLGLILPHPDPTECGNNCIFCFVHQLPRGMRRTLYVKDEDYRFSYLYGAYVTLTNIDEASIERILAQQLSPLYVSVHATDEDLRQYLLGKKAPPILDILKRLVAGGIEIHAQIVVCPEINDAEALEKTYRDLVALAPGICSLALVPVGLTGHRDKLPDLRPVTADEARQLLEWTNDKQAECLEMFGSRFVYAADELYLTSGEDFPALACYEDFPQIENGVGLVASFRFQAAEVLEIATPMELPVIDMVTGMSAAKDLGAFVDAFSDVTGVRITLHVVENRFFAGHVTVTGLLTGSDLMEQLPGRLAGDVLLLPDVMLRDGEAVLLDDTSLADLEKTLGVRVEVVSSDPWGVWEALAALTMEYAEK
jgi:putative radical SAM enzyme (TIGR03279 family)